MHPRLHHNILGKVISELGTGVIYLLLDEGVELVGQDSIASIVIRKEYGEQMSLVDKCVA